MTPRQEEAVLIVILILFWLLFGLIMYFFIIPMMNPEAGAEAIIRCSNNSGCYLAS